jgi:hypothetical protein
MLLQAALFKGSFTELFERACGRSILQGPVKDALCRGWFKRPFLEALCSGLLE